MRPIARFIVFIVMMLTLVAVCSTLSWGIGQVSPSVVDPGCYVHTCTCNCGYSGDLTWSCSGWAVVKHYLENGAPAYVRGRLTCSAETRHAIFQNLWDRCSASDTGSGRGTVRLYANCDLQGPAPPTGVCTIRTCRCSCD